jgi:hypothetical protein
MAFSLRAPVVKQKNKNFAAQSRNWKQSRDGLGLRRCIAKNCGAEADTFLVIVRLG